MTVWIYTNTSKDVGRAAELRRAIAAMEAWQSPKKSPNRAGDAS